MKRHRRVSLLITVDGSGKAGWSVKHPQAFIAEHHPKVLPIGQVNRVAHATAADKLIITGRGQLCHEGYPAVSSCPAFGTQTVIPLAYGAKANVAAHLLTHRHLQRGLCMQAPTKHGKKEQG